MPDREDSPFDSPEDMKREARGGGSDDGGTETGGPTLDEALSDMGPEEDRAAVDAEAGGESPEAGGEEPPGRAEGEAPTGEEEPSEPEGGEEATQRYRDPESGQFLSADQARERGLEPEELQTEQEAAEELFGGEGEEEEEEGPEPIVMEVPGEEEDEGFGIELEVDDPEAREYLEGLRERADEAETLQAQIEDYRETREQIERDLSELEVIEAELQEDPTPFVLENIPDESRERLVLDLIAMDEGVFERVQETIQQWITNPPERRAEAAERRADMAENRQERQERIQNRITGRQNGRQLRQAVERVAREVPEDRRDLLQRDLLGELHRYVTENNLTRLAPQEAVQVPEVRRRLKVYGVDPNLFVRGADTSNGERSGRNGDGRRVVEAQPQGEEAESLAEDAERYRQTGERLRRAHARRKDVGATTPSGAGGSPANSTPSSDATLDEALDWMDERMGQR